MQKEVFLNYQNKPVKIKLKDGFLIYGYITELFEDCLEFKSTSGVSTIAYDEIVLVAERRDQ